MTGFDQSHEQRDIARRRVVVVVGPHRSGSSAIARGLLALGVDLGDDLLPPAPDNPTGFWEHRGIVALNDRVLAALGKCWHSVGAIESAAWRQPAVSELHGEAVALINRESCGGTGWAWGFKDPRIARLLPFWRPVLEEAAARVSFVIALRHPRPSVESLVARDGFSAEKATLLWLAHMLPAIAETRGCDRVVVEYDRLVESPDLQLRRLADALRVQDRDVDSRRIDEFRDSFIDVDLIHHRADDGAVPTSGAEQLALRWYDVLAGWARSDAEIDDAAVADETALLRSALDACSVDFEHGERLAEHEALLARLRAELAASGEHAADIATRLAASTREAATAELRASVEEASALHDRIRSDLRSALAVIEAQGRDLLRLQREIDARTTETSRRAQRLGQKLKSSRDQGRRLAERMGQLEERLAAAERQAKDRADRRIGVERQLIERLEAFTSRDASALWRLLTPLRRLLGFGDGLLRGLWRKRFRFDLQPANELERCTQEPFAWRCTGSDPHFLLGSRSRFKPAGWCRVRLHTFSDRPTGRAVLYADLGAGFSENSAFELRTGPGGQVDRCLKLPRAVRAFRLDPADGPCLLTINAFSIQEVSRIEAGLRLMYGNLRQVRGSGIPLPVIARRVWQVFRRGGWAVVKQKLLHYPPFLEPASPYRTWILANDTLADSDRENMRRDISALAQKPLFSIVMPVYNTPAELLRRAIDSVTAQLYPNWQLCMANDASTDTRVAAILDEYAERDSRILVCHRRTNGHICAASNSAIELATGDFIALLDHDDELAEHALYWVARELAEHPEADVIYSDEDKIDAEGQRYDPHFKCDWNPDLFLSQNYMSHLAVYRRSLVTAVGGFREGFEGSQDYDLALRCTARTSAEHIRHIPKVLYHWRAVQGSTALATRAKDYATDAGLRALRDHLARHERLEVEAGPWPTTYRVRYPLPSAPPRVTLIIPTRDGRDIIETCIESILTKTTYPNYEIVIIDNQSTDPNTLSYLEGLDQSGRARVLRYDGPFNFSAINNYAVEHTDGQLVGLINNDIEVISPGWLSEMVSLALRPDAGAIGAKLYYADGSIQHAGVILGIGGVAGHSHKYSPGDVPGYFCRLGLVQNQSAVTAACLVVRRELYTRIGGFNERDLPVAFNDVDFCLRLREAGYRNVWTPHAELYHYESISRGMENTPEKQLRFRKEVEYMLRRWGDVLDRDPYYSPHLTRTREDFSLEPA